MMTHMARSIVVAATLLLFLSTAQVATARVVAPDTRPFDDTWSRWDMPVDWGIVNRTWMFGPDYTGALEEPYAESPAGVRAVQYFDKTRMEITNPNADEGSPGYVTNGLLASELIIGRLQLGDDTFEERMPAQINVAGDPDDPSGPTYATFSSLLSQPPLADGATIVQRVSRDGTITDDPALASYGVTATALVPETGHRIAGPFHDFMQSTGPLWDPGTGTHTAPLFADPYAIIGMPISEAYWSGVKVAGTYQDVLIQCFERRCLTYTPANPAGWQVESGNVGQHYYRWRYGDLPQPAGRIAFMSPPWVFETSVWGVSLGDISVVDLGDMSGRNLTDSPDAEAFPVWSPDGRQIAFISLARDAKPEDSDLYVMNADGTGRRRLTTLPGREMDVEWSPDGTQIAFTARVGVDTYQIAVANTDGSGARELTEGWDPAWSPDGSTIAFMRDEGSFGASQVFLMNADGSAIRQVTSENSHKDTTGWTPDGKWITFWEPSGYYYGVHPDGAGLHQLWDLGDIHARSGTLAWSPDGSKAAFIRGEYNHAYVINADGTGLTDLNPPFEVAAAETLRYATDAYLRPLWSPDGQFIAYESLSRGGLVRVVNVEHPEWPHRTVARGMVAQWSPAP